MAQKVIVALEDDLDGGPADETVRFGLDGTAFEIDLSSKNARAFRKQLAPFIEHARKAVRGAARRATRTPACRNAAATSGRGRRTTASRSATAAGSRPVSSSSTTPPRRGTDRPVRGVLGEGGIHALTHRAVDTAAGGLRRRSALA